MWEVSLPTKVRISDNKVKANRYWNINLNQYRNANHFTLNAAKVNFAEIVAPRLAHIPPMERIRISYWLYTGTKALCDVANVCSIVDKFFCDVLTKEGIIPDDNYNNLIMVAFGFGGIDKSNPRVEAILERL